MRISAPEKDYTPHKTRTVSTKVASITHNLHNISVHYPFLLHQSFPRRNMDSLE